MKFSFIAALLLGTTVAAPSHAKNSLRLTNQDAPPLRRVWVQYKDGRHEAGLLSIQSKSLNRVGTQQMELMFNFPRANSVVVTATHAEIDALQSDPDVLIVKEDPKRFLVKHSELRNRHRDLLEWNGQATSYGIELVQADLAREAGLTGAGVKVCVMDTGFDRTHEDFTSANINGSSLVPGLHWYEDSDGHGTHVSGIIAAANNKIGLLGVAPNAKIHMVGVFDESGFTYGSSLVDAAYKCRDAGAKIISMSLGGDSPLPEEQDAFTELYVENGILSVAAAGNNGDNSYSYPASYDNVLSVGAIDRLKNLAYFSQFNDRVDLVAPGVDIWSTLPMNFDCAICAEYVSSGYVSLDGTSQATPHVAGVAALLWSFNLSANVSHIHNALLASAEDLGFVGRDNSYGQGLVLAKDALSVLNATLNGAPLQDWTVTTTPDGKVVSCSGDELLVSVNLMTDRYGNETSWEVVRDTDGFTVMSGAGLDQGKTYQTYLCLPANCYTFSIYDSSGDGICCGYGEGHFTVSVDGTPVLDGGNFTESQSVSFGGNCTALSNGPKPSCVEAKLNITTDQFPFDTTISLQDLSNAELFWTEFLFTEPETEYTFSQCIDPTGCYRFEIQDYFGDGICCLSGNGTFALIYNGTEVFSGGNFTTNAVYLLGDGCENQS